MRLPLSRRLAHGRASVVLGGLAAALASAPLGAQDTTSVVAVRDSAAVLVRGFEVTAGSGYQMFDKSAALRDAPIVGLRITGRDIGRVRLGVTAAFARPLTRGDYFPWNRQIYFSDQARRNDTALVFEVSQRVTLASYGADAALQLGGVRAPDARGLGAVQFEVGGGVGGYTFWLDPEQVRRSRSFSGLAFSAGAGVGVPVGGAITLRLRVDDVIFTNFDRQQFSLSVNPVTTPPEARSIVHNPRFSVGFSFIPGAGTR
jgi:hypothetical protein